MKLYDIGTGISPLYRLGFIISAFLLFELFNLSFTNISQFIIGTFIMLISTLCLVGVFYKSKEDIDIKVLIWRVILSFSIISALFYILYVCEKNTLGVGLYTFSFLLLGIFIFTCSFISFINQISKNNGKLISSGKFIRNERILFIGMSFFRKHENSINIKIVITSSCLGFFLSRFIYTLGFQTEIFLSVMFSFIFLLIYSYVLLNSTEDLFFYLKNKNNESKSNE